MKKLFLAILSLSTITCVLAQTPHTTITTTSEKIIIPEGITINPADGKIYVSSIGLNKIIPLQVGVVTTPALYYFKLQEEQIIVSFDFMLKIICKWL